jgi:hypothetical protein
LSSLPWQTTQQEPTINEGQQSVSTGQMQDIFTGQGPGLSEDEGGFGFAFNFFIFYTPLAYFIYGHVFSIRDVFQISFASLGIWQVVV